MKHYIRLNYIMNIMKMRYNELHRNTIRLKNIIYIINILKYKSCFIISNLIDILILLEMIDL